MNLSMLDRAILSVYQL